MRTPLGACCIMLLFAGAAACKSQGGGQVPGNQTPQYFPTQEEAIAKAKSDFLAVLQSNANVNLGIDAATLERSQPGPPVRRADLDFNRLLTADSTTTFSQLVASDRDVVIPLMADNRVVTITEVVQDAQGWRVVGLAGRDIATDLATVMQASTDTTAAQITLYEVPNLQARVYGVNRRGTETLYTDYRGRFSLQQGVSAATLIAVMRPDAIEFQRVYGDSARANRLLR